MAQDRVDPVHGSGIAQSRCRDRDRPRVKAAEKHPHVVEPLRQGDEHRASGRPLCTQIARNDPGGTVELAIRRRVGNSLAPFEEAQRDALAVHRRPVTEVAYQAGANGSPPGVREIASGCVRHHASIRVSVSGNLAYWRRFGSPVSTAGSLPGASRSRRSTLSSITQTCMRPSTEPIQA